MASKLFRCTNANCAENGKQHEFEHTATADDLDPACTKCKTKANDPLFGDVIVRLTRCHFNPPAHIPGKYLNVRACNPKAGIQVGGEIIAALEAPNPFHNGTTVASVVNCPECKATDAWRDAIALEHGDEPPSRLRATLQSLEPFRKPAPAVAPIAVAPIAVAPIPES